MRINFADKTKKIKTNMVEWSYIYTRTPSWSREYQNDFSQYATYTTYYAHYALDSMAETVRIIPEPTAELKIGIFTGFEKSYIATFLLDRYVTRGDGIHCYYTLEDISNAIHHAH
jgi:hypothetical protein